MLNYTFVQNVKALYGVGTVAQGSEIMDEAGYKNAFVVYDQGVKAAGIVDKVFASLERAGIEYTIFDKVVPDPPDDMIAEGSAACKEAKSDCVIGVGGGSTIDTAKAINFLRFVPPPILRYADPAAPTRRALGLISIPTTAGTGSELSNGIVITDSKTGDKVPILGPDAMSEYCIIDPELMVGMPPTLTMYTGLDVMAHAAESYTTVIGDLMKNQLSEKVIEIVYKWLPVAVKDGKNIEARSYMAIASSLGGFLLAQAGTNAGHTFAHVLGSKFNIPHGAGCAIADPYVFEYNAPAIPEKTKKIGELLGAKFTGDETPEEIGEITRKAYIKFRDIDVGMKPISEFGVDKSMIGEIADICDGDVFIQINPRPMNRDDIAAVLEKMLA